MTKTQLQIGISQAIETKFNGPHQTIQTITQNQYDGVASNIEEEGFHKSYLRPHDAETRKDIFSEGDGTSKFFETKKDVTNPNYELKNNLYSHIDKNSISGVPIKNMFRPRRLEDGGNIQCDITYLVNFKDSEMDEPFAYFGIGGKIDNGYYIQCVVFRYDKINQIIDKVLFTHGEDDYFSTGDPVGDSIDIDPVIEVNGIIHMSMLYGNTVNYYIDTGLELRYLYGINAGYGVGVRHFINGRRFTYDWDAVSESLDNLKPIFINKPNSTIGFTQKTTNPIIIVNQNTRFFPRGITSGR